MKTKKVAIVGASGYSGEELVKLLLGHPHVELAAVTSRQNAGQTLAQVFPKFASHPKAKELRFVDPNAELLAKQADVVFLALPHGVAAEYAIPLLNAGSIVIDLSADFRLKSAEVYKEFYAHDHPAPDLLAKSVYGLPEFYREQIKKASLIASPGCYPTSILLPTLPLLKAGLIKPHGIIADSHSGVSGAGRKAEVDYLFCECNESVRPYGVPKHRHLSEIEEQMSLAADTKVIIQFTPHLMPVNRGILTTLYLAPAEHFSDATGAAKVGEQIAACYAKYENLQASRNPDQKTGARAPGLILTPSKSEQSIIDDYETLMEKISSLPLSAERSTRVGKHGKFLYQYDRARNQVLVIRKYEDGVKTMRLIYRGAR